MIWHDFLDKNGRLAFVFLQLKIELVALLFGIFGRFFCNWKLTDIKLFDFIFGR